MKIEIAASIPQVREILESVQQEMRQSTEFRQLLVHYDVDPL